MPEQLKKLKQTLDKNKSLTFITSLANLYLWEQDQVLGINKNGNFKHQHNKIVKLP